MKLVLSTFFSELQNLTEIDKKVPNDSTFSKWKEKFPWLLVTHSGGDRKIICTIFKSQKEKNKADARTNMHFIDEKVNFKSSTFLDHVATDGQRRPVKEKNN